MKNSILQCTAFGTFALAVALTVAPSKMAARASDGGTRISTSASSNNGNGKSEGNKLISAATISPTQLAASTDAHSFIEHMVTSADSLDSYSFSYQMSAFKDGKSVVEKGDFYFKKPRLMRLEVTEGKRKGSVAVLESNGKVRGKAPGLGFLTSMISLSPDSSYLKSVNGYPMCDSDYFSLARALKEFLQKGCTAKMTKHVVAESTGHQPSHLIEVYTDKSATQLFKRVFVDADSYLPVEWYDYEDGKLSSQSSWRNFQSNKSLPATLFSLKGDN